MDHSEWMSWPPEYRSLYLRAHEVKGPLTLTNFPPAIQAAAEQGTGELVQAIRAHVKAQVTPSAEAGE